MLQFFLCLFGLHGATEIDYTIDDEEIKVCSDIIKSKPKGATHYRVDVKYPTYWIVAPNGIFYFTKTGDIRRSHTSKAWLEINLKAF